MFAELFRSPHNTFTIKPAIFSKLFLTAMLDESIGNADKLYICFYIMLMTGLKNPASEATQNRVFLNYNCLSRSFVMLNCLYFIFPIHLGYTFSLFLPKSCT